jgi:L-alanine-DL-glutamate epimerase-like enolase superfamily enzyme
LYYFDANGRYDTKERLKALTDFFKETGILDRVILFEEPFAEKNETDVSDIPVTFALDESIHNLEDAKRKIKLGYKALTLKPVAKTLTLSMRMARLAHEVGVECFTADLTVNPVMLEWNKNFAARLSPLKKMKIGVVESNGKQNYSDWERLKSYLPKKTIHDSESFYFLDRDFYENPIVFTPPTHYLSEEAEK